MAELGAAGEAAWQTLRQHLEWAEGPWFGWVFVAAPLAVRELVARTDALPIAGGACLVLPLDEAAATIERLFSEEARGRRAVWIVGQGLDPAAWETLHLLLNERRERLRRHLGGGLLFAGRPEWKERTRSAAPDLWSQRLLVLEWEPPFEMPLVRSVADVLGFTEPLDDPALVERALKRAEELSDRSAQAIALTRLSRIQLQSGVPGDARETAARAVDLALTPAIRARAYAALATAEWSLGDPATAASHLLAALDLHPQGDEAATWALRAGAALSAVHRWAEAERAFERVPTMTEERRLRARAGELRALALLHLGRVKEAGPTLARAVKQYRALFASHDGDRESLRDLGRALVLSADIRAAAGDLDGALDALTRCVDLLEPRVGDPAWLDERRLLLAARGKRSRALRQLGRDVEAADGLRGALSLARSLVAESTAPAFDRTLLGIALADAADLALAQGDRDAAHAQATEALALLPPVDPANPDDARLRAAAVLDALGPTAVGPSAPQPS